MNRSKANKQHWFNSLSDHTVTLVPPQSDLEILAVFCRLQTELSQKMKSKQTKFHNGHKIPVKAEKMKTGLKNPCSSRISFPQSVLSPLSMYSCLCKQKDTRCIKASLFLRAHGKGEEVRGSTACALGAEWNRVWKCAEEGR